MSFDIHFFPCRFCSEPVERIDQETGKSRSVLPNEPLTDDELAAVRQLLENYRENESQDPDFYAIRCADGGTADVYASDLKMRCMIALRGYTRGIGDFLMELLKAGNWVMVPNGPPAVAASKAAFKSVPANFLPTVVCESSDELGRIINQRFPAWRDYRDHIVEGLKGSAAD